MKISATIPGKLILLGEYAVLHQAPAIVAAVNRFLHITLQSIHGNYSTLKLPHLGIKVPLVIKNEKVRVLPQQQTPCADIQTLLSLVNPVLIEANRFDAVCRSLEVTIDSSEFFSPDGSTKLGIGASAALAVGFQAILRHLINHDCSDKRQLMRESYDRHNRFQGSTGSGIDVAASVFGGVLQYRLNRNTADYVPDIARVVIPGDLQMCFIWTGKPSSTSGYLETLANYRSRHESRYFRIMQSLASLADVGCKAMVDGDIETFFQIVRGYYERLEQLGAESGIPIISGVHRRIAEIVYTGGGFYKPSGAGGGDFGILFSSSRSHIAELAQKVTTNGYTVTGIDVGARGIQLQADEGGIHDSIRLPPAL